MFDDSILLEHESNNSPILSPTSEHYLGATPSTVEIEQRHSQILNLSASFTASGRHNPDAPPSSKYESLDYDQCENMLQVEEEIMSKR